MSANVIHERLARIARQVLSERFASTEDQADAMAAAVINELWPPIVLDTAETPPDPHAGELWANELERRKRSTAPGEWS